MSVVWGDFESMAVFYLKELAKRGEDTPLMLCKLTEPVYGVCSCIEYAKMIRKMGHGLYRIVSAASADEFMGLVMARFMDFMEDEADGSEKKDIPAGQQPGSERAALDAGGDKGEEGGRGENPGSQQEEDNHRKVH